MLGKRVKVPCKSFTNKLDTNTGEVYLEILIVSSYSDSIYIDLIVRPGGGGYHQIQSVIVRISWFGDIIQRKELQASAMSPGPRWCGDEHQNARVFCSRLREDDEAPSLVPPLVPCHAVT